MKNPSRIAALTIVIALGAASYAGEEPSPATPTAASGCPACRADEEPVAIVDGVALTRRAYKDYLLRTFGASYLDTFIHEHLLAKFAARAKIQVSDEEVSNWVAQRVREASEVPEYRGADEADLRRQYLPHARFGCLLEQAVKARRTSEEGLRREYELRYGERRRGRHILCAVKLPPGATPEQAKEADERAREKAEKIRAMLLRGAEFSVLAKKESDDPASAERGGELPEFGREDMVREFADVAFSLKEGVVSEPVRSQFGWHVIEITQVISAARPFDERLKKELAEEAGRRPLDRDEVARFLDELRAAARIERCLE